MAHRSSKEQVYEYLEQITKEFDFELTPDENTKKIIFFAWNGFTNPRVLESCAVFE